MSLPSQTPSLYAAILFQSRINPYATAISVESGDITYGTFCGDIEKVTRRLHRLGLARGTRVAVHILHPYLRWVAIVALARLGAISASVSDLARELDFMRPQLVLSDRPSTAPGPGCLQAGLHWLDAEADAWPPFRDGFHDLDAPCRMVASSGTTGTPKKVILTYGDIRARIRNTARTYGLNATARLATMMGTGTIGGFMMCISCWAGGGTIVLPSVAPGEPMSKLLNGRPNIMLLSPAQLSGLMDSLPRDHWPWQKLAVFVAGSALPPSLSREVRMRLTQSLFILYGSTEAGSVTMVHASRAEGRPGFTGYVLPTAEVQIVNGQGQPVANGEMGEVRIRSDGMVEGYVDESESSDSFRDGWFYPGDAGVLDDEGGLSLLGRTRELMNLGGVKIAPEAIEQALSACPGIRDMAVFSLAEIDRERPWVAVVAGEGFSDEALLGLFKKAFPRLPAISIARMEKIPRNEMGKVLRTQLQATVGKAIKRQRGGRAQAGKDALSA